jgi:hypothetical protein
MNHMRKQMDDIATRMRNGSLTILLFCIFVLVHFWIIINFNVFRHWNGIYTLVDWWWIDVHRDNRIDGCHGITQN